MASPSLLHSSTSSFHCQFPIVSAPSSVRVACVNPRNGNGVVTVKATGNIVLVDKSESEKTYRLKNTYLEKIVLLLKDEFSYTNIHQVVNVYLCDLKFGFSTSNLSFIHGYPVIFVSDKVTCLFARKPVALSFSLPRKCGKIYFPLPNFTGIRCISKFHCLK